MEPNTSLYEDIAPKAELNIHNLINRFADVGHDGISQESFDDAIIVIFDLDTTDLSGSKEICQISAKCNNTTFNQYILPDKDISFKSSQINGFEIRRFGNERKLFHNRIEVKSLRPREGLTNFLNFLRVQSSRKVLLAAHNCFTFDGNAIIREIQNYDLFDTFQSLVLGFIDTIQIFKSKLPNRIEEKKNFNLPTLANDYELDEIYILEGQHAAVNVKILDLLLTRINCTDEIMKQHAKNLTMFIQSMPENVKPRIAGLEPLSEAISLSMRTKIAKAGISMEILRNVYDESGNDGISTLLQEDVGGKPRITRNQKKIQSIISILLALSSTDHQNAGAN